ncbi:MAG TPA: diguanylate cyclase [Solirubrobacteraceae bacterium]|jgi:diguanylate cyclase (GGDEF)-like protein|nr:diguanylate cyclase [Solirubrobacteraceae bacterium]
MPTGEAWRAKVVALGERCGDELLTRAEFEAALQELLEAPQSPFSHVHATIHRPAPWGTIELGARGEGDHTARQALSVSIDGFSANLDVWAASGGSPTDPSAIRAVQKTVETYLAMGRRTNAKTHLIGTQTQGLEVVLARSLRRLVREHGATSLLFADLDHLKDLNSEIGEAKVDGAFGHLAVIFETAVGDLGLALHRSGDEFLCVYPGGGADAISLAQRACAAVAEHDFGLERALSISVGVASIDAHTSWSTLAELEERAERALKPSEAADGARIAKPVKARRGTVSLLAPSTIPMEGEEHISPSGHEALAVALVKSSVGKIAPFRDPWLNAISRRSLDLLAEQDNWQERSAAMAAYLAWLSPAQAEGPAGAASLRVSPGPEPRLSGIDVALACAHGILRGALLGSAALSDVPLESELAVDVGDDGAFAVTTHGRALLSVGGECRQTVRLGGLVLCHEGAQPEEVEPRRVLLVRIGHADVPAAQQLFADVITVDDRPVDGGGLPDFWEAAIARTVDRISRYPDVTALAIVGKRAEEYLSVKQLLASGSWGADSLQLAQRTGLSETALVQAGARLREAVTVCENNDALAQLVADTVLAPIELHPVQVGALEQPEERFLDLRADMAEYELPPQSGCAVTTGARAYPLVLQLLRDAGTEAEVPDAAGVPMIDLIDFRLLVREPGRDQIPGFYLPDTAAFEEYYKSVFLDEQNGLFATRIHEQLGRVIAHLAHAIGGRHPFSTRRAILVVEHALDPLSATVKDHDVRPLGLVSVRIIPRFEPRGVGLHMSFTWRTVEALVGLPYSLYGSLRYSQHLTALVRERLGEGHDVGALELREVSYLAHSLHVTTDSYGQNIARRIIYLSGR